MSRPRMSLIKEFDPLYKSPSPLRLSANRTINEEIYFDSPNNSNHKNRPTCMLTDEKIRPTCMLTDENYDPMFSETVDISETSFIKDIRNFAEGIIVEAITTVCPDESFIVNNTFYETADGILLDNTQNISNVSQTLVESNDFVKDLEKSTAHCTHDIEISDLKSRINELEEQFLMKNEEYKKINEDYNNVTDNVQALEAQLLLNDEEFRKVVANIKELEEQVLIKDENLKNMEENANKLKAQILINDEEIKKVQENVKELEAQISIKDQELSKTKQNYEEMLQNNFPLREKEFEENMTSFEQMINSQANELKKLKMEHDVATQHLSNLEIAFSDVHQKYERSKVVINGYRANEDRLQDTLSRFKGTLKRYDENLELMKKMASNEINRLAKELIETKEESMTELNKLLSKIKHLEIKNASLANALEQKNIECRELTNLCDEITTKKTGYF